MPVKKLVMVGITILSAGAVACLRSRAENTAAVAASEHAACVLRITGSDTMVNLVQSWAERYRLVRPLTAVQVAGGGSGVGIAALTNGLSDIAASSREMTASERARAVEHGAACVEFPVALDALAVYVHRTNPLESIAVEDLAEIYGENRRLRFWSQLSIRNAECRHDSIIRIGRQNSSGTFAYFREAVLGRAREYALGSIDQSGSKDVVALVSRTPCAIGYSGMAYATDGVKALRLARTRDAPAVAPAADSARDGSYPLARRLYLYTGERPSAESRAFIDWVLGPEGQQVVQEIGFVPVPSEGSCSP